VIVHPSSGQRLQVLIVDDEALARSRLRTLLSDVTEPATEVVAEAANATQALVCLQHKRCDVVLLDIAMPGRDGTQLAAELQRLKPPPAVVFVTAHAEHALRAFELDAVDYLTKPVRRERLQAALLRVVQRLGASAARAPAPPEADDGAIVVTERGRMLRVPLAEVLYLKAELKYVTLRTAEHSHVLDDALADLEARLGERFLRVHRNALVAKHAVRALERRHLPAADADDEDAGGVGWAVQVAPLGEWLAVSRRQVAAVKAALGGA
jgi:two-component system response regulator AlgR